MKICYKYSGIMYHALKIDTTFIPNYYKFFSNSNNGRNEVKLLGKV